MKKRKSKKKSEDNNSLLYGSVTVGTKGQFVIPVEARKKLDIAPGDQLLVFGSDANNVLAVIKAEEVSKLLGDLNTLEI